MRTLDAPFVNDLVNHIKTTHQDIILDSREFADPTVYRKVVQALDMPPAFCGDMWPSLYRLFEEVRKRSTVALSGEASDELFGGYPWFIDYISNGMETFPWMNEKYSKFFSWSSLFDRKVLKKLDLKKFVKDSYIEALAEVPVLTGESEKDRRMRQASYIHITRWLSFLLDRMDRMSMASGMELRVPFCDHRLVEYVYNIPWEMKSFDGREKSILRASAQDLLPSSILERVKSPYPSTQDPKYEQELRRVLAKIAADVNAPVRPLLDMSRVNAALEIETGAVSYLINRIAMEQVIGLNAWLTEYGVTLDL
ncbi:hypothetical protein FBU30_002731 [Linnemannia zychae]|nr:hypothetical protein FBU30_002731 [Linnemannia zychae]